MNIKFANGSHLSYCTNVHPGETLAAIYKNLQQYVIPIKQKISPNARFGVGLRLSYQASVEMLEMENLQKFQNFCEQNNLYVFTINGFIYGRFHDVPVKENVYLPDWTHPERLIFSNNLAHILAYLLPKDVTEGSISTVPGAFKGSIENQEDVNKMIQNLLLHVAELYHIQQKTGRNIVLCLEPEPSCFIETIAETVEFFTQKLFSTDAIKQLQKYTKLTISECANFIKSHLGVCYDTCHMAIEYEEPVKALETLKENQIKIAKVQISSAPQLRFCNKDIEIIEHLRTFVEDVYLHQVVAYENGSLTRFNDLPQALQELTQMSQSEKEWRIHFHIPIFLKNMPPFETTQNHIVETIEYLRYNYLCQHYEAETYTWNVLPKQYRCVDLKDALLRELIWICDQMEQKYEK